MTQRTDTHLTSAQQARHELRAYLHRYGEDLSMLLNTLNAIQASVAFDELHRRHGLVLPDSDVARLVSRMIDGLDNLPSQFRIDDGALHSPYRNAAIRLEAEWHRDALRDLVAQLATAPQDDCS